MKAPSSPGVARPSQQSHLSRTHTYMDMDMNMGMYMHTHTRTHVRITKQHLQPYLSTLVRQTARTVQRRCVHSDLPSWILAYLNPIPPSCQIVESSGGAGAGGDGGGQRPSVVEPIPADASGP